MKMYRTNEILSLIYKELLNGNINTLKIRIDAALAAMEQLDPVYHERIALAALMGVVDNA